MCTGSIPVVGRCLQSRHNKKNACYLGASLPGWYNIIIRGWGSICRPTSPSPPGLKIHYHVLSLDNNTPDMPCIHIHRVTTSVSTVSDRSSSVPEGEGA